MKTLPTTITVPAAAAAATWTHLLDIYLPGSITTPWGTTNILRLTNYPGGLASFAPTGVPEPVATRGTSQTYQFAPFGFSPAKIQSANSGSDEVTIPFSNVTAEAAALLLATEWRDAKVSIRIVSPAAGLTSTDTATLFTGTIDSIEGDHQNIQLRASSDLGNLQVQIPAVNYTSTCRFKFADDYCGEPPFDLRNYKTKTIDAGSTTTRINATAFTEDTGNDSTYGTELILAISNAAIVGSTQQTGNEAWRVRSNASGYWALSTTKSQWGTNTEGYWTLPDAQAGTANPALAPHITFDFGTAKWPRLWRITPVQALGREMLPRVLVLFSSTDNTNWTHQTYFEIPPVDVGTWELLTHKLVVARYWRICVRNRWSEGFFVPMFSQIEAYEDSRHYWRNGTIRFDDTTTTVALRGQTRRIKESYSGKIILHTPLPVPPVFTDTCVVRRGCARTLNDCCARGNWKNFGGFPLIGENLITTASGTTNPAAGTGNEGGTGATDDRYQP